MPKARENAIISATVGTTDLTGNEGYAFKFHTDGTVIPIAAVDDAPAGVILEGAAVGEACSVALITATETVYGKLATSPGTVVRGTLLEITADGSLKADAGTAGTVCALALEDGAGDELIELALLKTAGTVTIDGTLTTCAASATGAVATISGTTNAPGKRIVGVWFGETAADETPHDFGDLAVTSGSDAQILVEKVTDGYAEVLTDDLGAWSLDLTLGSDDTVEARAAVLSGRVASASVVVDVP